MVDWALFWLNKKLWGNPDILPPMEIEVATGGSLSPFGLGQMDGLRRLFNIRTQVPSQSKLT